MDVDLAHARRLLAPAVALRPVLADYDTVMDDFAGAAATGRCLIGSSVIRDLMAFVDSKDEVSFTRPLPWFPVQRLQS
jgi:transcription initiation factor TFIID subunit 8